MWNKRETALQKYVLIIATFLFTLACGCTPDKHYGEDNVTEMKAQLSAINQKLSVAPMYEMEVFIKRGFSSVSFGYKPKDVSLFVKELEQAANEEGFNVPSKDYKLERDELLLFCNALDKHRYIVATSFEHGIKSITIYANNVPRTYKKPICY